MVKRWMLAMNSQLYSRSVGEETGSETWITADGKSEFIRYDDHKSIVARNHRITDELVGLLREVMSGRPQESLEYIEKRIKRILD